MMSPIWSIGIRQIEIEIQHANLRLYEVLLQMILSHRLLEANDMLWGALARTVRNVPAANGVC